MILLFQETKTGYLMQLINLPEPFTASSGPTYIITNSWRKILLTWVCWTKVLCLRILWHHRFQGNKPGSKVTPHLMRAINQRLAVFSWRGSLSRDLIITP